MAIRYWRGTTSTDWHNTNNWSDTDGGSTGFSVPTIGDDVRFTSNSNTNDCVASDNMSCKTILCTGWTKNFNGNGYSLTADDTVNFNGSGSVSMGSNATWTLKNNTSFASTLSSLNPGGVNFIISESLTLAINKALTTPYIKTCTIASGKTLYINGGVSTTFKRDSTTNESSIILVSSTSKLTINGGAGIVILSNGTCKPIEDNGGTISATTGYNIGFTCSDNTVYTLPKIVSGTNLLLNLLQAPAGKTVTYRMAGDITCRRIMLCNNGNGKAITNLYTDGYNINTAQLVLYACSLGGSPYSQVLFDCAGAGGRTSLIHINGFTAAAGFSATREVNSSVTVNMADSKWEINNNYCSFANCTVNSGTSLLQFIGTALARSLTFGGAQLYRVQVSMAHATLGTTFNDASYCNRLIVDDGCIVFFKEDATHVAVVHTVVANVSSDWGGSLGALTKFKSLVSGTQFTISNPTGMTISYIDVKDSYALNEIDVSNGTNVDSGNNNANWKFILFRAFWARFANVIIKNGVCK